MLPLLTICCCLLAETPIAVRPLRGEPVRGTLVNLEGTKLVVQAEGQRLELDTRQLQSVKPELPNAPPASEAAAGVWLELVDDSVIPGSSFASSGGKGTLRSISGGEIAMASPVVRSVRFHRQTESTRRQWGSIAAEERVGDVLVVRKTNPAAAGGGEVVLDQLTGVVHEIRDQLVVFEFDGDRLEVARAKIEGILFRAPGGIERSEPVCRVRDRDGGTWSARLVRSQGDRLEVESAAGVIVTLPLDRILEIDFSAANQVYLTDLDAERVEWRPYFQSPVTLPSLSRWFEPRAMSVVLRGASHEKSLALHSRTSISYRLPRNFRRFVATAGVAEHSRDTASLQLTISGDGRPLLTRTVTGADDPFDIELDLDGVRRLKIVVDFGDDRSDEGDLLYLGDARLVK